MATYQLTADELLLIYLTFLARDEEGHPEYLIMEDKIGWKIYLTL